ncbi:MAG: hypothetical protein NC928_04555 [Candidatus Omnitrophica bacterium]|nr:hypothetical protein [Candidatus Omnitrophota bacterium]
MNRIRGLIILALNNIVQMIKELKRQGTTVLLITHREEVSEIADKTSLMCSGFIVKEGKPEEMGKYFKVRVHSLSHKNVSFPDRSRGKWRRIMQDYELMLDAYTKAGGVPSVFKDSNIAHLVIHKNKVIGKNLVKGLILEPKETASGVNIALKVEKGIKIENPVHLCFGILPKEGIQEINIKAKIEMMRGLNCLPTVFFLTH